MHDTLEDTYTTYQEIAELFGDKIANMVQMETEIKGKPYKERKHEHMMRIAFFISSSVVIYINNATLFRALLYSLEKLYFIARHI